MTRLEEILSARELPDVMRLKSGRRVKTVEDFEKHKEEIKILLQEYEYGYIPPKPRHMRVEEVSCDEGFCAGKAVHRLMRIELEFEGGKSFSFPLRCMIPQGKTNIPAFVHISFRNETAHHYQPTEEIVDRGYAVFAFDYRDVTSDDGNFKNGIAPMLAPSRRRLNAPGKIAMWAWAAMRVMDYVSTLDYIDKSNVAVIGHSRLGKTALLTGAFDTRFKYVISNNSGCSGAAITRGKIGEKMDAITNVFPYWFCPRYTKEAIAGRIPEKFDQHSLLALSVPRHLIVGSAEEDLWADPTSEYLSLVAVDEVYRLYGKTGLIHPDEIPAPKTYLGEGDAMYHIRHGKHYLSREDWNAYMDYIDKFIK